MNLEVDSNSNSFIERWGKEETGWDIGYAAGRCR